MIPDHPTLPGVRDAAVDCQACELYKRGTQTGKRRIHKKPSAAEMAACRPWLDAEIELLKPKVIVCLGATAAQALLGKSFRVTAHRGEAVPSPLAPVVIATVHPSSILRAPDDDSRREEMKRFTVDLRKARNALSSR